MSVMFIQRFEPWDRRFINFRYYYCKYIHYSTVPHPTTHNIRARAHTHRVKNISWILAPNQPYRLQNTVGKLMERTVARKLARDLEDREILPANRWGGWWVVMVEFRPEKCTRENAAAFAYDVYEEFQGKEPAVAVAIDLEDAYNRVLFKLLMDLLIQYGVSLTLTR